MATHATPAFDEMDPHHELPHGHVIVRVSTLVGVLLVLLVFTVLTVASARAEIWATEKFGVPIPQLINVLGVLTIALIKSILVAMYFMQLRYDNLLNTIVLLFCLFAFVLFLFFSMVDLGNRGLIYPFKSGEIQRGGLGIDTTVKDADGRIIRGVNTENKNITRWARERRIAEIATLSAEGKLTPPLAIGETPEMRWAKEAAEAHHGHAKHEILVSTGNRSLPPTPGPTPGLYDPAPAGGHGASQHGGH